jgi:thioredoxin
MRQNGFEHVYELKGGVLDWQKNNYPLHSPSSAPVPDKISMEENTRRINSSDIVVIDYYAPWCGPCKKMEPMLNELSAEYKGKASIIRLNIDENRQLAKELKVEVIPILKIFRQGQETWTHNGYIEKADLIKAMGI